jgi:hypothetical protein
MIHELNCTIGYQCSCCDRVFEFEADAYTHDSWCNRRLSRSNQIVAEKQMAAIKLETFKPDGTRAGIALSEPQPIEIASDLTKLRLEVKNMIGRWS